MDILDTRDMNGRLEELHAKSECWLVYQAERAELLDRIARLEEGASLVEDGSLDSERDEAEQELVDLGEGEELDDDEQSELGALEELRDEIGDEFKHGVALIPKDYFEDYARELAEDIGAVDEYERWPLNCIDWEYAAQELRYDYSGCSWDGVDYLFRV